MKINPKVSTRLLLVSPTSILFFLPNLVFLVADGEDNIPHHGVNNNEPYFIEEPYDIKIKENSRTVLPCKVAGLDRQIVDSGGAHVQWTKDGFGLGTGRQLGDWPHFRMVGQNLESKILISLKNDI